MNIGDKLKKKTSKGKQALRGPNWKASQVNHHHPKDVHFALATKSDRKSIKAIRSETAKFVDC